MLRASILRTAISLSASTAICMCVTGCPAPQTVGDGSLNVARELEEADVVKLVDGVLYAANPYSGLRLIDVRDIDAPSLAGSLELGGRAVELLIRDDLAYIVTTADFFDCAGDPVGFSSQEFAAEITPDFDGSRLWIVDISDSAAPQLVSQLDIVGFVREARRVDNVLYLTGVLTLDEADEQNGDGGGNDDGEGDDEPAGVFIDSISIADSSAPAFIDSESFEGEDYDIAASPNGMAVLGPDPTLAETSVMTYVDIRDPAGDLVVGDTFRVPGFIADTSVVNIVGDTLFVVTGESSLSRFSFRNPVLYVYDISNPADVERMTRFPFDTFGEVNSIQYSDDRVFIATSSSRDPLFIVDVQDPSNPVVGAQLESPGQDTFLFPLQDRLLTIGFESSFGGRPVASLFDISPLDNARRMSIIELDGTDSLEPISVFFDVASTRWIDDGRLAVMPTAYFDDAQNAFVEQVRLISVGTRLTEHVGISHRGYANAFDMLNERLWLLSDLSFQTINIDDLDNPISVARLDDLGPNDQDLLDAGLTQCVLSAATEGRRSFLAAPCGILGIIPVGMMVLGLMQFRLLCRRGRHR